VRDTRFSPVLLQPATIDDAMPAGDCLNRSISVLCVHDHRHDVATLDAWLVNAPA
jgi:hypothetical protein